MVGVDGVVASAHVAEQTFVNNIVPSTRANVAWTARAARRSG